MDHKTKNIGDQKRAIAIFQKYDFKNGRKKLQKTIWPKHKNHYNHLFTFAKIGSFDAAILIHTFIFSQTKSLMCFIIWTPTYRH